MRFAAVVALAGCGFHPGPPVGDATSPGTWTVDSAAELAAGKATGLTIEPTGQLTELGYCYGGLLEHGERGSELWKTTDPLPLQWSKLNGVDPMGAALWNGTYFDTSQSLANVGITTNDVFALWLEGEVYLDANDVLALDANAVGFIDVLSPQGWMQQTASLFNGFQMSGTFPTAGWYRVRIGYAEGSSNGHLDVRHGPAGSLVPFTRDRLRAPCSEIAGTSRLQFYRQMLGGTRSNNVAPTSHLEEQPLIAQLPALDMFDWSARWSGQFYAATPGPYELTVTADDASATLLGTAPAVTSHWVRGDVVTSPQAAVIPATLDAGWNDLIVAYGQVDNARSLAIAITGAPDATLIGKPIPRELLRAVEPRADRLIARSIVPGNAVTIPNDTGVPATLSAQVDGFPTEVVTHADVTVLLSTQHVDQLVITLTPPGGSPVVLRNHVGTGGGNLILYAAGDAGIAGGSPVGLWTIGVADNVTGGNTSALQSFHLTLHTSGGPEQIALAGTWVSPVHDLGAPLAAITDVAWIERAPQASQLFLRTCEQPDCADDPPWSDPIDPHATPALTATRYLQAKLVMHSDGTKEGELDSLTISYATE